MQISSEMLSNAHVSQLCPFNVVVFLCPQEAALYPLRMRLLLHQQQLESMRQQHQVLINKHQNSVDSAASR